MSIAFPPPSREARRSPAWTLTGRCAAGGLDQGAGLLSLGGSNIIDQRTLRLGMRRLLTAAPDEDSGCPARPGHAGAGSPRRSARDEAAGRVVLVLAALLTLVHAAFMVHCGGMVTVDCDPSRAIDLQSVWLDHTYRQGRLGHDPEGLVAIYLRA